MNYPSKEDFLAAVKDRLDAHRPMEFARALGLGPDGYQKVNRWNRDGRIDYEDTMRMLERCGWLNLTGEALPVEEGGEARWARDPLTELRDSVEASANSTVMAIEALQLRIETLATQLAAEAAQPQKGREAR